MLKRLISLLLAVMLLLGTSALADKNVNELIENALYRIVLRTDAGDSILGSGVLFVESNVLLTPASCLQEGSLYAIGTDGEYPITVASLLDDSGVAMMEIAAASANQPLHMASENSAGMACLFGVNAAGDFTIAPLNQLRNTIYHGQDAMLLSSDDGLLPGAFLTDEHGDLIGLTLAQHGEGAGTYLSLDANGLYRAMSRQQYAEAFLPVEASYAGGLLTLSWQDENRTEGKYLITLSADDNAYYTFFEAPCTDRSIEITVAPGHRYDFQVQWTKDLNEALDPVWGAMSSIIVPASSFTSYAYSQECTLVTRTDVRSSLAELPETTLKLMSDPGLLHYLRVNASYDITEPIEVPLTVEILAPDGQFYYESAVHVLSPKKETNDAFLLPLDDLLSDCAAFSGGVLALGQYELRYALNGATAGEIIFDITEKSQADIAAEEAAADAAAAEEAKKNQPKTGFVTQLTADYKNGAVSLTWPAEEIPEGATVDAFYLYEGNNYYVYHRMNPGEHATEIFTVPGRETMIWVYWTLDPTIEMVMPHHQGDYLVIPATPETAFTLHGFENQRLSVVSSTDPLAVDKGKYLPEQALTRETFTNREAFLYFQTEDTYQVQETSDEHPMVIVLCTPEGLCFIDPLVYMFDPSLQTSDMWLKDISNLCRDYESLICGAWPAGDYRILYCIDGQVAGEINFTLGEP